MSNLEISEVRHGRVGEPQVRESTLQCCSLFHIGQPLNGVCKSVLHQFSIRDALALTARLGHLGIAAREVAGRRHDLMVQEERARREDQAYHAAYVRGRGGRRRGLVV